MEWINKFNPIKIINKIINERYERVEAQDLFETMEIFENLPNGVDRPKRERATPEEFTKYIIDISRQRKRKVYRLTILFIIVYLFIICIAIRYFLNKEILWGIIFIVELIFFEYVRIRKIRDIY